MRLRHRSRIPSIVGSRRKFPARSRGTPQGGPMPTTKEFTILLEDRPGTLGKLCQALAEQSVNILAFHSCPLEKGKSTVRLVLDNPSVAKSFSTAKRQTTPRPRLRECPSVIVPGSWRVLRHVSAKRGSTSIMDTAELILVRMRRCYFSGLQTRVRQRKF